MPDAVQAFAREVRDFTKRIGEYDALRVEYAIVTHTSPLRVTLTDGGLNLGADDLVESQSVRRDPPEVDEVVIVAQMPDGDWAVLSAVTTREPEVVTVTAGDGLTLTGDVLDVVAGNTSLTVSANSMIVNTSVIATVASVTSAISALSLVYQPLDATLASLALFNTNGLMTQTAADTFTGRTITGTASRLSVTNGNGVSGNPTLNIDTGYVGQTSITTLGTVTTGTWQGTVLGRSFLPSAIAYEDEANSYTLVNTFTKAADAPVVLRSGASGSYVFLDVGRTANEVLLAVAAASAQFTAGTAAGDVILRNTNAANKLFLGVGTNANEIVLADDAVAFFAQTPSARASTTADIKDALTAYGLLQGTSATPLNLDGGALTAGASSFSGNVAMGTNKHTGLGAGTTNGDSLRYEQVIGVMATLASPTFTGDPKAPTPSLSDNDTSLATTAFVQQELAAFAGTWQLYRESPTAYLNAAGAGVYGFSTALAVAGIDGYNGNGQLWRFYIDDADFANLPGKTLKFRIRATVSANGTDPGQTFDFKMYAVTFSGGANTLTWDVTAGSPVGNTASITNANLNTNETEKADSTSFSYPGDGVYTITVTTAGTMAANSAIEASCSLEYRWE